MSMNKEIIIIADYTQEVTFTLEELSEICGIEVVLVRDLITYDIIIPIEPDSERYRFDMVQLQRLQKALRLQRDLELNYAGIALVLHLLDELEDLRARAELLNKHLLK